MKKLRDIVNDETGTEEHMRVEKLADGHRVIVI